MNLGDRELNFIKRVAGRKKLYLFFSISSVVIALLLIGYYGIFEKSVDSARFVIVILILLSGRAHLRQYRCAAILEKLMLQQGNSKTGNSTACQRDI